MEEVYNTIQLNKIMKKNIKPFNVINFEFNSDKFEAYDVMPYFVRCYLILLKGWQIEALFRFIYC